MANLKITDFPAVTVPAGTDTLLVDQGGTAKKETVTQVLSVNSVLLTGNQSIAGIKTFTDTTDSTTKDTGGVILDGGLGVEKTIAAGGKVLVADTTDSTTKDTGCVIVEGGIGAEKNIVNGGYIKSGKGRWPISSIHGSSTANAIFDALDAYIPNTNDEIIISGGISSPTAIYIISRAIRTSATVITLCSIYGQVGTSSLLGHGDMPMENGDSTVWTAALSW